MFIGTLQVHFYLRGCLSLKEKRSRLSGLRDKFGSLNYIAVSESDYMDTLNQAQWAFVCLNNDRVFIESCFEKILEHCAHNVDAELTDHRVEWV